MPGKSLFGSKTFLVNALTFAAGVIALLSQQTWLPPEASWLVMVQSIVNIALRLVTDLPIKRLL